MSGCCLQQDCRSQIEERKFYGKARCVHTLLQKCTPHTFFFFGTNRRRPPCGNLDCAEDVKKMKMGTMIYCYRTLDVDVFVAASCVVGGASWLDKSTFNFRITGFYTLTSFCRWQTISSSFIHLQSPIPFLSFSHTNTPAFLSTRLALLHDVAKLHTPS